MTVIYKIPTFQIVRVDDINNINILDLKDDEDFMPVEMWNESDDKETFPTIEIPSEGIIGNTSMAKMIDETIHPEKYREYPLTRDECYKKLDKEEYLKSILNYSVSDKFDIIGLTALQLPINMDELSSILNILVECKKRNNLIM